MSSNELIKQRHLSSNPFKAPRIGFAIGEDMYRFGWKLDSCEDKHIIRGFSFAQKEDASRIIKKDHFDSKLLQLRKSAYQRGLEFDLTREVLEQVYKDTEGKCPVFERVMTQSQLLDSDWSVDRLDSDKGYIASNIIMMSTKANRAKDRISLEKIMAYVLAPGDLSKLGIPIEDFNALTPHQWVRLFFFIFDKLSAEAIDDITRRCFYENKESPHHFTESVLMILFFICATESLNITLQRINRTPLLKCYLEDRVYVKEDIVRLRKLVLKTIKTIENIELASTIFLSANTHNPSILKIKQRIAIDISSEDSTCRMMIINTIFSNMKNKKDRVKKLECIVNA